MTSWIFNVDWILYFRPDLNLKIMFFKERASLGVTQVPEQKYCWARYTLHLDFWRSEKYPTILMMIWSSFISNFLQAGQSTWISISTHLKASLRAGPRHPGLGLPGSVIASPCLGSAVWHAEGAKITKRSTFFCFIRKDKRNSCGIIDLEMHWLQHLLRETSARFL